MTDLLRSEEIRQVVRDAYRRVGPNGGAVARELYDADELALFPLTYTRPGVAR